MKLLDDLKDAVTRAVTVEESAKNLIQGIPARLQAAKDEAIANGATAEELAPIQDEIDALNTEGDALVSAVTANTPAAAPTSDTPADASTPS